MTHASAMAFCYKDPKLLSSLAERLKSREPIFNPKD
jgi:hypothetical protein